MCYGLTNNNMRSYEQSDNCLAPVAGFALYEVNYFVLNLNYCEWTAQYAAGKILGSLGYMAVMVAAVVEAVVLLALSVIALLPSVLFKNGLGHVAIVAYTAMISLIDTPVRCVSGFVQNVLLNQEKSFERLNLLTCLGSFSSSCARSEAVPVPDAEDDVADEELFAQVQEIVAKGSKLANEDKEKKGLLRKLADRFNLFQKQKSERDLSGKKT